MIRRRLPLLLLLLAVALVLLAVALGTPRFRIPEPPAPWPPVAPAAPATTAEVAVAADTLPVELPPATAEVTLPVAPPEPPKPKPKPPEPDEEELPEVPPKRVDGFRPPRGFSRVKQPEGSFARFVQTLPLKRSREIMTWKGKPLAPWSFDTLAVVDLPLLFRQDLEQCADFAMRLFAEWHRKRGTPERLVLYHYPGTPRPFRGSGKSYDEFLRSAFSASNSHSLKKGLPAVKPADLRPGDLVVQNETGGIGHVSVVMDMCEDAAGRRMYLFGFSFMPAQELHLERARPPRGRAGWFTLRGFYDYLADRFPFGPPVLRRFPQP